MTVTITLAGVLLTILCGAAVLGAILLLDLYGKAQRLENRLGYVKNDLGYLNNRLSDQNHRISKIETDVKELRAAFQPTVTAWAANQNRPAETPKAEG